MAALALANAARLWRRRHAKRDDLIAATITSMPLLMPDYMDYDLLLLAVPTTLLAARWLGTPESLLQSQNRALLAVTSFTYVVMYFNPALASRTPVNGIVPCIAVLATLWMIPATRPTKMAAPSRKSPAV